MMNLLSDEKKKNDPLYPAPSPAENIRSMFLFISKDIYMSLFVMPS